MMTGVAAVFNPSVFHHYWDALLGNPPYQWVPPTIGTLLRTVFGSEQTYLTFVAPALGVLWVGYYCHSNRMRWRWDEHMPLVVLVSVMMTAYGWVFDHIVLLIPIIVAAQWARKQRGPVVSFGAVTYLATCVFGLYVTAYQTTLVADVALGIDTNQVRTWPLEPLILSGFLSRLLCSCWSIWCFALKTPGSSAYGDGAVKLTLERQTAVRKCSALKCCYAATGMYRTPAAALSTSPAT